MNETELLQRICKVGDIVRVQDCHHAEPHFYEVSYFKTDCFGKSYAVSQPADFSHSFDDVTAIYRYDGKDLKCIWERSYTKACADVAMPTTEKMVAPVMRDKETYTINFGNHELIFREAQSVNVPKEDIAMFQKELREKIYKILDIPKGFLE